MDSTAAPRCHYHRRRPEGYSFDGQSQGKLLIDWLTDQPVTGYCSADWTRAEAHAGSRNVDLTGAHDECAPTAARGRLPSGNP